MRKILYILILLLMASCSENVDPELEEKMNRENFKWSVRVLKVENDVLVDGEMLNNLVDTLRELKADSSLMDTIRNRIREWNAAYEMVSEQMSRFLDDNSVWLKKLGDEGMKKQEAETWWQGRKTLFGELDHQAVLMKEQLRDEIIPLFDRALRMKTEPEEVPH